MFTPEQRARQIVSLLDLTTLSGSETESDIRRLCQKAKNPGGTVAAVCVYPRSAALARKSLNMHGLQQVKLATVANFPHGECDPHGAVEEIRSALTLGVNEIDLVFPYKRFLSGDAFAVRQFLESCRQACPLPLKVILETGVLASREAIAAASRLAVQCGADFLKTSTGKTSVHATPEAARAMLEVIAETGGGTGFKASGGLRTVADALPYLLLAEGIMGSSWVGPDRMRFGASSLLDDVLAQLAGRESGCVGSA